MLKCGRCGEIKELRCFNKDSSKKRGHASYCKICKKERELETKDVIISRRRRYYEKNKERILELQKEDRRNNPDKYKQRELLRSESKKEYRNKNKEALKKKKSSYRKKNQSNYNAREAKRRAGKLQATPNWYEKDKIEFVYKKSKELSKLLGEQMEVDHIIPLQGKDVCGLHVWENLQILEKSLNVSKGNRSYYVI